MESVKRSGPKPLASEDARLLAYMFWVQIRRFSCSYRIGNDLFSKTMRLFPRIAFSVYFLIFHANTKINLIQKISMHTRKHHLSKEKNPSSCWFQKKIQKVLKTFKMRWLFGKNKRNNIDDTLFKKMPFLFFFGFKMNYRKGIIFGQVSLCIFLYISTHYKTSFLHVTTVHEAIYMV